MKNLKKNLNNIQRIGIDTNIFIYHFGGNPQYGKYTHLIFNLLKQSRLKATTSTLTISELLSFKTLEQVLTEISDSFFATPNLTILDVSPNIAIKAAQIKRDYGYRLVDSIQLATAIQAKAQVFITNDQKLKRCKDITVLMLSSL